MNCEFDQDAQRLITNRCLIATDVDKTILTQVRDKDLEKLEFLRQIAPQIVESARHGTNIALLTGNSMHQLCSRMLVWLIEQMGLTGELHLIERFHFFCNSGGVYFHFNPEHEDLRGVFDTGNRGQKQEEQLKIAIQIDSDGEYEVKPQFVDATFVERCMINPRHVPKILGILEKATDAYVADLVRRTDELAEDYELHWVQQDGQFIVPKPEMRATRYRVGSTVREATVQITLKPILSFRQAKMGHADKLFRNDLRCEMISLIQEVLNREGLWNYIARPGGRGSIDITLEKLDKAYGLEFLIDRLEIQGNAHLGQEFGANAIYFGDEVIVGGGNDFPAVRIPGLLVMAVNVERNFVPFLHGVLVPSTIFEGPKSTAQVLSRYNDCAARLLRQYNPQNCDVKNAIEGFKQELFLERIKFKVKQMETSHRTRADDLQALHTFITLLSRNDPGVRRWLGILIKQLDGIMTELAAESVSSIAAIGDSHHTH